jgi:hypothetical protein
MAARRNRYWVWFFVIVVLLTAGAVVTLIAYNARQQLKPEELEAARQRWEQHALKDYDLTFTKTRQDAGGGVVEEEFLIRARQGRVVYGEFKVRHGRSEFAATTWTAWQKPTGVPVRLYDRQGVEMFFNDLEGFLRMHAQPGATRNFLVAQFDADDGHVLQYVWRQTGTSNRVEVRVNEVKPATTAPLTAAELTAARRRWDSRAATLADYHLEYVLRQGDDLDGTRFAVDVRGGKVELARRGEAVVAPQQSGVYDMGALFAQLEAWQAADAAAGRTPGTAAFDSETGQLRWYRRTEPEVEFFVDPAEPLAAPKHD